MKVICIDDDFTDFIKLNGSSYNFPKLGHTYEVRGESSRGGYLLKEITNPFFLLSFTPLLFEELHFNKNRFMQVEEVSIEPPYLIHAN